MKTINKITIIVLGLAALTATSCSDKAFDKYPTDSMQMETYVKNDAEALTILYDAYYYLRSCSESVIRINGLATDEAYDNKRNNSTDDILLNECTWDATLGMSSGLWSNSYYMLNRCNTVIDHAEDLTNAALVAEAKFLRAYAYFNLVRLFGACPLTTSVISDYKELYNYGREPVESIYKLIEQDLADAISGLPESRTAATEKGRATKIAAWTLLADVQMTRGNFSAAKSTLDNVINYADANPDKLGLEDSVKKIYDSTNPIGKEIIFAAQYNDGATSVTNGLMQSCTANLVPATQPAYTYADGKESSIKISQGNGRLLMTWELWNKLRADKGDARGSDLVYTKVYDFQSVDAPSAEVEVFTEESGATHAYVPNSLKYFDFVNEGLTTCRSSNDNIIYRYGGVLLMYAECLNETGGTADAVKYLNRVRSRAGAADTEASSQADVRLAIENENLLELCFEGHRWFNLVRTGRITAVMEEHFNHRTPGLSAVNQANNNGMVVVDEKAATGTPAKWKWSGNSNPILFPIPYDQIQLTNWDQNQGY